MTHDDIFTLSPLENKVIRYISRCKTVTNAQLRKRFGNKVDDATFWLEEHQLIHTDRFTTDDDCVWNVTSTGEHAAYNDVLNWRSKYLELVIGIALGYWFAPVMNCIIELLLSIIRSLK